MQENDASVHTVPSVPIWRGKWSFFKLFDICIKVQIVGTLVILSETFMFFSTFILVFMWHKYLSCLTVIKSPVCKSPCYTTSTSSQTKQSQNLFCAVPCCVKCTVIIFKDLVHPKILILSLIIKNILICVQKIIKGLVGLQRHVINDSLSLSYIVIKWINLCHFHFLLDGDVWTVKMTLFGNHKQQFTILILELNNILYIWACI